jgi:hypothetical protein
VNIGISFGAVEITGYVKAAQQRYRLLMAARRPHLLAEQSLPRQRKELQFYVVCREEFDRGS